MTTTRPLEIASVDWSVIAVVFVGVIMLALLCYCIHVLARDKSSAPGPREEVQVQLEHQRCCGDKLRGWWQLEVT